MTETQEKFVKQFGAYIDYLNQSRLDYNTLINKMQRDKKFDNMIVSMTIGRVKGKSVFDKNKIQWK